MLFFFHIKENLFFDPSAGNLRMLKRPRSWIPVTSFFFPDRYGGGRHDAYTGYEYHGSKGASWHLEVQEADVFFSAGCWWWHVMIICYYWGWFLMFFIFWCLLKGLLCIPNVFFPLDKKQRQKGATKLWLRYGTEINMNMIFPNLPALDFSRSVPWGYVVLLYKNQAHLLMG